MDEYERVRLPGERAVVMVASTTGQGETPDNMKRFWRFLRRKDLPAGSLSETGVAVFGLGDSSYPIYNAVARRLYQRLLNLGAKAIVPRGLGDDQHPRGYDGALEPWLESLYTALGQMYPLAQGETIRSLPDVYLPRHTVKVKHWDGEQKHDGDTKRLSPALAPFGRGNMRYTPVPTEVRVNRRLTAEQHFQDVRHIELDLSHLSDDEQKQLAYRPGDVVCVHPRNPSAPTAAFVLKHLGGVVKSMDDVLEVAPIASRVAEFAFKEAIDIPSPITVRELAEAYLDLFGTPSRSFFEALAVMATEEREREKLEEFCSAEGQDDLYRYNNKEKRTYIEVFEQFPSAMPSSIEQLIELVPRIKPRMFSISSSPLAHPRSIHITAAIVRFQTPYKRWRTGVCTSWLATLRPGARVFVGVRQGSFHFSRASSTPVVMVGPGTGVAPFRAMVWELSASASLTSSSSSPSSSSSSSQQREVHVFLGHRSQLGDFLYSEEWHRHRSDGVVTSLHTAFSRDGDSKVYVQHRIGEAAAMVWDALYTKGGTIMVAGSANKMPKDVRKVILAIATKKLPGGADAANKWLRQLESSKRYVVEAY
eukprot:TRINITY_DN62842_c0_g1_i1.p1 TRINITY_DN62842_c0_g1~~TRINITY_DN62842_c0_g1_i1.p1  ORF type:complete len:643 (+),score=266.69 TRINITY_DN62842_c0_g1_i1:159-1931(+)